MTKGHMYNDKKKYVETILKAAFEPVPDFLDIRYIGQTNMDTEYIRIDTLIGTVAYFDVTAFGKEEIFRDTAKVVLAEGDVPQSLITNTQKLREVAVLFQQ